MTVSDRHRQRAKQIAGSWWDEVGVVVRATSPHPLDKLADKIVAALAEAEQQAVAPVLALADELDREGATQLFHGPHNWNQHITDRIRTFLGKGDTK